MVVLQITESKSVEAVSFFVDDGTTTARVVESTSAGCWPTDGTFRSNFWTTCGGSGNILQDHYR